MRGLRRESIRHSRVGKQIRVVRVESQIFLAGPERYW